MTRIVLSALPPLAIALLIAPAATAQFNNQWLKFQNQTASRLTLSPTQVSSNSIEVDMDVGDFDHDGDTDLAIVRKQPFTTGGKQTNLLLMNENGVLTDRSAQFASATDVTGDNGFLTPTNDRDLAIVDVDNDGWLDIVTATTLSFSDSKAVSHPRVYRNLGADPQGNWLGFKFENARTPQFFVFGSGVPFAPEFCAVSAGDVTGDGFADLYFTDYDAGGQDLNDRLLINNGAGFFTDESQLRMTSAMLQSGFGTSGSISDFNNDGKNDVMKSFAGFVGIHYNNPANIGHFTLDHSPWGASTYHVAADDLNNDGRVDFITSDDGLDEVLFNTGVDALNRATWSSPKPYTFLPGAPTDDGIGGSNHVFDFDQDGWKDTIHADVDVDIPGCGRRAHLYHNMGGTPGTSVTLREERETTNAGWVGAVGLTNNDLVGTYDEISLDVNNDGAMDLVLGRCSGTFVFINQATVQPDLGFAGPGHAHLSVTGGDLSTGTTATLKLTGAEKSATALLLVGLNAAPTFVGQFGGTIVPLPMATMIQFTTNAKGEILLPGIPGGGGPLDIFAQFLIVKHTPNSFELSNAIKISLKP